MSAELVIDRVRSAFFKKPRMCMHELAERTDIPYTVLRQAVIRLLKQHQLVQVPGNNKADRVYQLTSSDIPLEAQEPTIFGLTETVARNRVIMIRRMKARLIIDWHPVLDIILNDYERGLRTMEIMRIGFEDEAEDDDDDPPFI